MVATEITDIDKIIDKRKGDPGQLIEVLQDLQNKYQYLSEDTLRITAEKLHVPLIEVYRVANFYKAFKLNPSGKYLITVCLGTACHVRGASKLVEESLNKLKIELGETTVDKLFTVETVNCVGACALGPVVIVNGKYYDHMSSEKIEELIDSLAKNKSG